MIRFIRRLWASFFGTGDPTIIPYSPAELKALAIRAAYVVKQALEDPSVDFLVNLTPTELDNRLKAVVLLSVTKFLELNPPSYLRGLKPSEQEEKLNELAAQTNLWLQDKVS